MGVGVGKPPALRATPFEKGADERALRATPFEKGADERALRATTPQEGNGAGVGTLYVVATPIGNAADITMRAREALARAHVIAAEDTRAARALLASLGLLGNSNSDGDGARFAGRLISNHKFNERQREAAIAGELLAGRDVAVVSDAGTPCISDPGDAAVRAALACGARVVGVCGPSAVALAISVSGFPCPAYAFYGFAPRKEKEARALFARMAGHASDTPVAVLYDSPLRVQRTMGWLAAALPGAAVALCNDLTKKHERVYRGSPAEVAAELAANPAAQKGEYTLVVELTGTVLELTGTLLLGSALCGATTFEQAPSLEALLVDRIAKHGGTLKDAVAALAAADSDSPPKRDWYNASLRVKKILDET